MELSNLHSAMLPRISVPISFLVIFDRIHFPFPSVHYFTENAFMLLVSHIIFPFLILAFFKHLKLLYLVLYLLCLYRLLASVRFLL